MKRNAASLLALGALIVGCNGSTDPSNKAPVRIFDGATRAPTCVATDQDNSASTCTRTNVAANGTIAETGAAVTFNPPSVTASTVFRAD